VTPTPQALFVTPKGTVALELGKDYNLSFRDNTEVGNARCILLGKGATHSFSLNNQCNKPPCRPNVV
jgi:hypothetical protein